MNTGKPKKVDLSQPPNLDDDLDNFEFDADDDNSDFMGMQGGYEAESYAFKAPTSASVQHTYFMRVDDDAEDDDHIARLMKEEGLTLN